MITIDVNRHPHIMHRRSKSAESLRYSPQSCDNPLTHPNPKSPIRRAFSTALLILSVLAAVGSVVCILLVLMVIKLKPPVGRR